MLDASKFDKYVEEMYIEKIEQIKKCVIPDMEVSHIYSMMNERLDKECYHDFCDTIDNYIDSHSEVFYENGFYDGIKLLTMLVFR